MTDLIQRLRAAFRYDPQSGHLYWAIAYGRARKGNLAGWRRQNGYRELRFDNNRYFVHRIIWMMAQGEDPETEIDHINGDQSDNRLENLRKASREQNNRNTRKSSNNTSGVKGVSFHKDTGKWIACLRIGGGKQKHLGLFPDIESAAHAVREARQKLHGEFHNHG